jgi:hypothetical protein
VITEQISLITLIMGHDSQNTFTLLRVTYCLRTTYVGHVLHTHVEPTYVANTRMYVCTSWYKS